MLNPHEYRLIKIFECSIDKFHILKMDNELYFPIEDWARTPASNIDLGPDRTWS